MKVTDVPAHSHFCICLGFGGESYSAQYYCNYIPFMRFPFYEQFFYCNFSLNS